MADNSMYWSDQSGWYQQPGPPLPPPTSYQSGGSYPPQGPPMPNEPHNNHASPSPHNHQQAQTHPHQIAPQPPPPQQQQHQPPTSSQQQQMHHQQMMPNGAASNGNHNNMQSTIQCTQPGPPSQPVAQMNQYNSQSGNLMQHHEPMNSAQTMQPIDSSSYQIHHQANYHHQHQQPPAPMYAQSNPYSSSMPPQGAPNSMLSNMQQINQHQPQSHSYPQQQYSPAPYWNQAPIHSQPGYGPPSASQSSTQSIPTPPSALPDNASSYHTNNVQSQQQQQSQPPPPPPPSQQHQQSQPPQPPAPSNMPYESRGSNHMPANYNSTYHQQSTQGYYSPHDIQQQPNEPAPINYDMPHQTNTQSWSNGYYQPSQSPYPGVMNSYPVPYNSTNSTAPCQPHQIPPSQIQGPPQSVQPQQPHYAHHQAHHPQQQHPPHPHHLPPQHSTHGPHPHQSQQWPPQNHNMPIIERNKVGDKKPVKPRAPKKQSNPNAPTGRRKRPFMTEEHKQSGYAKYYQIERKKIKEIDFGLASKKIAEGWAKLSPDQRSAYVKDVSIKRKEMLKKKASQQAQNLLVQGMTQEQGMLIQGVKRE